VAHVIARWFCSVSTQLESRLMSMSFTTLYLQMYHDFFSGNSIASLGCYVPDNKIMNRSCGHFISREHHFVMLCSRLQTMLHVFRVSLVISEPTGDTTRHNTKPMSTNWIQTIFIIVSNAQFNQLIHIILK
jgi:hypothetical protein